MWVTKIMWFLSKIFSFEDYYKNRKEKIEKDKDLNEFMYGKNASFSIGWAHHWFGYFYSCYSGFISFIAFGIYLYCFHEVNKFILCVLIFTPVLLCFIPAQKAVFKDDRYLRYFKKFEKEDELWHKKWRKITEVLQAAIPGTMKQNHDQHDLRLGKRPVTVIRTLIRGFYGIFCHHCIIKFEKIICNTENFSNFVLAKH